MTDPYEQPAVPFNKRRSDDPMFRIARQAESRAKRNGMSEPEQHEAGRKAMALRRMLIELQLEPKPELILETVAGEFRR